MGRASNGAGGADSADRCNARVEVAVSLKLVDTPTRPELPEPPDVPGLRLSAHAGLLAKAIYFHHRELYQLPRVEWYLLSGEEKKIWSDMAIDVLVELEPEKCILCGERYQQPGSEYCDDDRCAIEAERG